MKYHLRVVTIALGLMLSARGYCDETPHPLWEAGAGVAGLSLPDYRGSSRQRGYLLPIPYFVYRGEVLQIDRDKVRGLMFKSERLELDVSVNGSVPVKSDDDPARQGMPNLRPTVELGPQVSYKLFNDERYRLQFQLPVRGVAAVGHGIHGEGWLANPQLALDVKDVGPRRGWNLGLSGGPMWADARYHNYFYGVDPAYATPSRPTYTATGGYSGTRFTMALSKRFHDFWVGGFVQAYDLHGVAFENSPLLERRTSYAAGIGVSWIFGRSEKMVMSEE